MICHKCGTECPDGNIFCEACGAELDSPVLPENVDEKGRVKKTKKKKAVFGKAEKAKAEKKQRTAEEKASLKKKLKVAGIAVAVIAVIILIALISNLLNENAGFNAAQNIPVGRNIEYAQSETKLVFMEKSTNGLINNMAEFDYICVSEDTVKVNGSEHPRWVIMLTVDAENIITDVEYYDFKQLKLNWMGRVMPQMLDQSALEYGMSMKNVNKTLGLKPYYFKRSISNDSVYCYRYYYNDPVEGYDRAFNYYVEFSEVELTVKNVSYSEIDYAGTILAAGRAEDKYAAPSVKFDETDGSEDEGSSEESDEDSEQSDQEE